MIATNSPPIAEAPSPLPAAHAAVLAAVEVRDGAAPRRVPLVQSRLKIGRAPDSQIHLDNASVSRHHADLYRDPFGRWHVQDQQSRNGTIVNGQRVDDDQVLAAGDVIQVGGCTLAVVPASVPLPQPPSTVGQPPSRTGLLDDAEQSRISTLSELEPPRIAALHLSTLSTLSQQLLATADPQQRREAVCRLMVGDDFHAQSALVVRVANDRPDEPPELLCQAIQGTTHVPHVPHIRTGPAGGAGEKPYVSRSLIRAVRASGSASMASNIWNTAAPAQIEMSISPSIMAVAAVCCPLQEDAQSLDALYAILPPQYGTSEWLALASLAARQFQQAEQVWRARAEAEAHAAVEHELQRARQIQMRLVPRRKSVQGLDLEIGFLPCRWVGGDYVDVVPMGDGRTLLAVADVCGKGLGAALVSASLHTAVHSSIAAGLDLRGLMRNLNRYLCQTLPGESFVTMVAVAIDPATGSIECINAGHPPPVVVGPDGESRELQSGENFPLGCDDADPEPSAAQLPPGGLIALYTDGLTEQSDEAGELLGIRGLTEWLCAACPGPATTAAAAAETLTRRLDALRGQRQPDDDRTFLLARRL